ncbi:CGNR zinc finger domain-containing protein [Jidongwangia harbinensis]|uniref:CGNR zinc finger domain-containing protein n=1 Tax=Jidongwangia harbinensis TaxID=2878561 RepID=UPI001CDA0894|nr:CGNR zinc finger domain-containing protein [Jidongwangia harbinensis]MCA2211301.1 CGNR zinc finger domain-containing protein [Jidongwangia harbinensis]
MVGQSSRDEAYLLALLNTTPTVDGARRDQLADDGAVRDWVRRHLTDPPSRVDPGLLRATRDALQHTVRATGEPDALAAALAGISARPALAGGAVTWTLTGPAERMPAARAVLAWDALAAGPPGRLRACANDECSLFLVDHSKSNNARWCSMAVCGNRMKARRHYTRRAAQG